MRNARNIEVHIVIIIIVIIIVVVVVRLHCPLHPPLPVIVVANGQA